MTTQAHAFIEKLKDKDFRKQLRMALFDVKEGDWAEIVRIASEAGFEFTEDELRDTIPSGFFRGAGADPDQGWGIKTLFMPSPGQTSPE